MQKIKQKKQETTTTIISLHQHINDQSVSNQFVVDSVNNLLIAVTNNIPALSDHVFIELWDSLEQCPKQSLFQNLKFLIF